MSTANTLSDLKAAQGGGSASLEPPSIDDLTPVVGQTLTATTGSPRSWQWKRDGADITGETNPTYLVDAADIGAVLTVVEVQATPTAESSPSTGTGAVPSNATTFTVNGTAKTNGSTTNLANGTTSATIAATDGGSITTGPTGDTGLSTGNNTCTFTITAADGVTQLNASITLHVMLPAPTISDVEQDFPAPTVGDVMTLTITSENCTSYSYVWKADGSAIPGATNATYTAERTYGMGKVITCVVTGHNETGNTSPATSDATAEVTGAPVCTVDPTIATDGANAPGGPALADTDTLTVTSTGTWTGYPTPTVDSYEWVNGDIGPVDGSPVNTSTYAPVAADADTPGTVRCLVSMTNSVGTVAAASLSISITT